MRATVALAVRNHMAGEGFCEVGADTPTLRESTLSNGSLTGSSPTAL
jgi:aspartyl-tRNA synthetase